jgi:hypothetical protein
MKLLQSPERLATISSFQFYDILVVGFNLPDAPFLESHAPLKRDVALVSAASGLVSLLRIKIIQDIGIRQVKLSQLAGLANTTFLIFLFHSIAKSHV